jgi:hypothetical protein
MSRLGSLFWIIKDKLLLTFYQYLFAILLPTGCINCADVNLSEGEASFESEFHKKYFEPAEEKKAGDKIITKPEITQQGSQFNNVEIYFLMLQSS